MAVCKKLARRHEPISRGMAKNRKAKSKDKTDQYCIRFVSPRQMIYGDQTACWRLLH
jgi:hypothetical protein